MRSLLSSWRARALLVLTVSLFVLSVSAGPASARSFFSSPQSFAPDSQDHWPLLHV
jgi:hypothetical protein